METPRAKLLLLALSLVLWARPGWSQHPDSAARVLKTLSVEQLLDLEVTSVSRRPEPLTQAASAIQVITDDDIRRSGASSLPEALRLASNLQVAQVDARQWAISARGFNGTTANKLLVLIDGRTVYTPLFSGVFWDVQDVPLEDIDRIEVISGPGAPLWGANAVNGVINVITKDATATRGLLVSGGGGSELRGFGTLRYGGTLGSAARYRVYGRGFAREPTILPGGQEGADDWRFGQGGFRVEWDASPATQLALQGDLYDGRVEQASGEDIAVSGGNVMARWSRAMTATSHVTAQLFYDRTHRDIPNTFGEHLEVYDVEVQHALRFGTRTELVWGVGYRLMNDYIANSAALAFLPAHVTRRWWTGFAQTEVAVIPDRLFATLGSKVEHNEYTGFEIQPGGRLRWTTGAGTLWAAVTRALRTPSRIDRELFAPGQPPYAIAGGPDFRSEEALAYELGYRHQHGSLALAAAGFYTRYHGLRSVEQVNPPQPAPVVIANGQDGESYGAELTADYWLTGTWRLQAGYTELRVQIRPDPGSTDTSRGAGESRAPDRQLLLRTSVDLPARLTASGAVRAIGAIANQQVPAYTELNVALRWQPAPGVGLSVVGQNLLHRRHAEFGAPAARRSIERGVFGAVEWRF